MTIAVDMGRKATKQTNTSLLEFMFNPRFQFVLSRIPSFEGWYLEIVGAWNWLFGLLSSSIFSFSNSVRYFQY